MNIKNKINEEILLTLVENEQSKKIEVVEKIIEMPLIRVKKELLNYLQSDAFSLEQISQFINGNEELKKIDKYYAYCESLSAPYQGVSVDFKHAVKIAEDAASMIRINKRDSPDYDSKVDVENAKLQLINYYDKAFHAHDIHLAYRQCNDDPKVLSFSHRICGWSEPRYQLTTNFTLELKTNFGYGRSSYFYTRLTYKDVEITPISDWVRYEYAEFMEIVRYSKKHELTNDAWDEAMQYTKEACNLSRIDEAAFVRKYIINECRDMVEGLVYALHNTHFILLNAWHKEFIVDKTGHVLMEYRGEKISGALSFIEKILEFEHITAVQDFINTIKDCNRKLEPWLADELITLAKKIDIASKERSDYKPVYDNVIDQERAYEKAKNELRKELISQGKLSYSNIDYHLLNKLFNELNKDYNEFLEVHNTVTEKWRQLNQHLSNLRNFQENIGIYHKKINDFFN